MDTKTRHNFLFDIGPSITKLIFLMLLHSQKRKELCYHFLSTKHRRRICASDPKGCGVQAREALSTVTFRVIVRGFRCIAIRDNTIEANRMHAE